MKNMLSELESRGYLARLICADPELVSEIERAQRAKWLPIQINVRAVEALCSQLGEERGLQVLAEGVFAQFEKPLWKNFISPAMRLLGRNTGSAGRWIPAALGLIFRDCGQWSAERSGECEVCVRVRELPESLADHRLWLRSLGVGMSVIFMLTDVDGKADLAHHDAAARTARFELSWKARA